MSRLQQQLDQLKLKVFKVSQIKAGGHQVLSILVLHIHFVLGRLGESDGDYKTVAVTLAQWRIYVLAVDAWWSHDHRAP